MVSMHELYLGVLGLKPTRAFRASKNPFDNIKAVTSERWDLLKLTILGCINGPRAQVSFEPETPWFQVIQANYSIKG